VLKDADKRAAYDRFGHAAFEHGGGGQGAISGPDFGSAFSESVRRHFPAWAGSVGRSGRERAAPTCATIWRSASTRALRRQGRAIADPDLGRRARPARAPAPRPGTKPKPCPTCAGAGAHPTRSGLLHLERTCPGLQGRWPGDRQSVPDLFGRRPCHARAHVVGQHPAGCRGRHPHPPLGRGRGRVRGGPGGRPLYFFLSLAAHPFFQRDGADLHCRAPISMVDSGARRASSRCPRSTAARPG